MMNILKYLRRTKNLFLIFGEGSELWVKGYTDSDFMSDPDDRKSISEYVFVCNSGAVSWKNFKQPIIADLTTEAEYVTASNAAKEGFWFKKFIAELKVMTSNAIPLYCNNNGAIHLLRSWGLIINQSASRGGSISYATISKKSLSRCKESTPHKTWRTYWWSLLASRRSKLILRRWVLGISPIDFRLSGSLLDVRPKNQLLADTLCNFKIYSYTYKTLLLIKEYFYFQSYLCLYDLS